MMEGGMEQVEIFQEVGVVGISRIRSAGGWVGLVVVVPPVGVGLWVGLVVVGRLGRVRLRVP
jgi:hypothetical protein